MCLLTIVAFTASLLVGTVYAQQSRLPECSGSYSTSWTNCVGGRTNVAGETYFGEWKDGTYNGQGTVTLPDGGKYVGEFRRDTYHGQGTMTYRYGTTYVGGWFGGYYEGQGTYTWPNGEKYVGEFRGGKESGQGTKFGPNGAVLQSGLWENGKFVRAIAVSSPAVGTVSPPPTPPLTIEPRARESDRLSLDASKIKCAELGFKPATEAFGKCVLQLSK